MGDSSIYFARPSRAPEAGYDPDGKHANSISRLQVPVGERREFILIGPAGTSDSLGVTSNNDGVIRNVDIEIRSFGGQRIVTVKGNQIGNALLDVGFAPFQGGTRFPSVSGPTTFAGAQFIKSSLPVQVTRADGTMPGQSHDSGVPPEGQMDLTACWAACLAWWLRALPDRENSSQKAIMTRAAGIWSRDGTLSLLAVKQLYERMNVKITCEVVSPTALDQYLVPSKLPLILGFRTGVMGGHVNVIHAVDTAKGNVTAMEPWYPDPSMDPNYAFDTNYGTPVYSNKARELFQFRGSHVTRPISYYKTKPMGAGFLVCNPY